MIDLKKFCCTDGSRAYLMTPFTIGEFTYATNGHIAVRVPALAEWPVAEKPGLMFEKAPELFAKDVTEFKPLPSIEFPPIDEEDECSACDGRGHEHDCEDCQCICSNCAGTGLEQPFNDMTVGIGTCIFHAKYIALLKELPAIEIGPTDPREPVRFRFAGGEAVIMPRSSMLPNHVVAGAQIAA